MSDCHECTLRPHLKPSLAADEIRPRLLRLITHLRRAEELLAVLSSCLPEPGTDFDVMSELRSGMDCVRLDLLADATQTLDLLVTLSEDELRARFEERRAWLVAAA